MLHPALRRSALTVVVAVSFLVLGGLAEAATKITPPIGRDLSEGFYCRVLNASNRTLNDVTIEIINSFGVVIARREVPSLMPGRIDSASTDDPTGSSAHCRVEGKFPAKSVFVSLCRSAGTASLACVTSQ